MSLEVDRGEAGRHTFEGGRQPRLAFAQSCLGPMPFRPIPEADPDAVLIIKNIFDLIVFSSENIFDIFTVGAELRLRIFRYLFCRV